MGKNKFIGQITEFSRYATDRQKEGIMLDLTDRKIMYLLSQNARLSSTAIAKKLSLKRETVAYRIKRMEEQDFLHGYLTSLDTRKLGFKNYMVYLKFKTFLHQQDLLSLLLAIKEVTRMKNCSGIYDLQLVISVKTEEEFVEIFEEITNKFHQQIQTYEVHEILEEHFLGLSLLLTKEDTKNLGIYEHKGSTFQKEFDYASRELVSTILDEKDKGLLELLKLDANSNIKTISTHLQLAPIAIENRIKKLIKAGIIKNFLPLASLSMIGYQWWKVFFKFKNLDKKKFLTFLQYHSNVPWYMRLLGKWDYQISVFAKDNAEFHQILDEIRSNFSENIINYDSIIVFNQMKHVQRVK